MDYDYSSEEDGEEPHKGLETALATPESNASRAIASPGRTAPIRLPNAVELLGASHGFGSTSRTTTESSSKKRPELNGSANLSPPLKLPRRDLPSSRTSPDTAGGLLLPPQLRGRSNVVTDDIDKLFVRRRRDS